MKIQLICIGKTDDSSLQNLTTTYEKRLKNYISCTYTIIPAIKNKKNLTVAQQKEIEGKLLLQQLSTTDFVVLLDEKGQMFNSISFAGWIQKQLNASLKQLIFIIGGPYGFSEEVYVRANAKLSLSTMTFSHQMIRLFFIEQLYRAFTILKNENYHHE